jgi:uncharacterized protein involved in exopolysaccharide biosynthesis
MVPERSIVDFLKPLGKHTVLIALIVLVVAAGTLIGAVRSVDQTPYEATAQLLLNPVSRVNLEGTGSGSTVTDPSRIVRSAGTLMMSLDVANRVHDAAAKNDNPAIRALGDKEPVDVRGMITVENSQDLLVVKSHADSADVATWLANTWAEEGVAALNEIYAETSSSDLNKALDKARTDLTAAEKAVQDYLAKNPISGLEQELKQANAFIDAATDSKTKSAFALYNAGRDALQRQLDSYYAFTYSLEQTMTELRALRTRIEQSADDPNTLSNNQLSLMVLQNKALAQTPAVSGTIPSPIQFQISASAPGSVPPTRDSQLHDVDSTLTALQRLQEASRGQIGDLQAQLSAPVPTVAPDLVGAVAPALQQQIARINELQSELEARNFELSGLQKNRDLQQSTYDLLRSRQTEQQINQQISGVANITSPASSTDTLRSRHPLNNLLLSAGMGIAFALVLGLVIAYLLSLLRPNFSSNAALKRLFQRNPRRPVPAD